MKELIISLLILLSSLNCFTQFEPGSSKRFKFQYEWRGYFDKVDYDLDPIEGIWEQSYISWEKNGSIADVTGTSNKVYIAIFKRGFDFEGFCLDEDFQKFRSIKVLRGSYPGSYKIIFIYSLSGKSVNEGLTLFQNTLRFSYTKPDEQVERESIGFAHTRPEGDGVKFSHTWTKQYPRNAIQAMPIPDSPRTTTISGGTGFAISRDGYIVTNHHVIEGARSIIVKDVNIVPNKEYKADVIISDAHNDIAILKIADSNFITSIAIPYSIRKNSAEVGESVFALGYPLTSSMGTEVKLTNGIISSRTGFQGDITSYQISVPVHPGNSGGPLFDSKGNIIGVINAKHSGAENASYAIKINYLRNLLDLMESPIVVPSNSTLSNKSLPDKVKVLRKIVYLIEAYN